MKIPEFQGGDDETGTDGGMSGDGSTNPDGGISPTDGGGGNDAQEDPPSCRDLGAVCGVTGNKTGCCLSYSVPATTYYRGYDYGQDSYSGNTSSPATLRAFRLDAYEVTVGRYRAFLDAGGGTQAGPPAAGAGAHPWIANSGWSSAWSVQLPTTKSAASQLLQCSASYETWTPTPAANEQHPINCVTWYEAMAFCAWDGGFLPTEAEWNAAAAGGDQQRTFPWVTVSGALTIGRDNASYNCLGDTNSSCSRNDILDVGSRPQGKGRWGHFDLAGNMDEWTLDSDAAYSTPCTDCASLAASGYRTTRGGSFTGSSAQVRTGVRASAQSDARLNGGGFRCARAM